MQNYLNMAKNIHEIKAIQMFSLAWFKHCNTVHYKKCLEKKNNVSFLTEKKVITGCSVASLSTALFNHSKKMTFHSNISRFGII